MEMPRNKDSGARGKNLGRSTKDDLETDTLPATGRMLIPCNKAVSEEKNMGHHISGVFKEVTFKSASWRFTLSLSQMASLRAE